MHNKKMFDFENEGQGHGVQHSPWCHSMALSTTIKVIFEHFSLALTVFEIFTFKNLSPWKYKSRLWHTTFAVAHFDGKYLTSYLMALIMNAFFQRLFVKIVTWEVWCWKFRSMSWNTTLTMVPFDGKYHLYQIHTWAFFASPYCFPDIPISNLVTLKI